MLTLGLFEQPLRENLICVKNQGIFYIKYVHIIVSYTPKIWLDSVIAILQIWIFKKYKKLPNHLEHRTETFG